MNLHEPTSGPVRECDRNELYRNKNINHFTSATADLFHIHNLMLQNIRGFNNTR